MVTFQCSIVFVAFVVFFFQPARLRPVNTKHPPDAFLMHSALIRCLMAASVLPSHLQGLEAALAVGVIVLTIKATERLSSHLEKSFFFCFFSPSFQLYKLALAALF